MHPDNFGTSAHTHAHIHSQLSYGPLGLCLALPGEPAMEDAMDRSRWRKQIGMTDDHGECEWVNVSSGTGSLGLSRTNSTEP